MTAHVLDNAGWHALTGPHAEFAEGDGQARRYRPDVSVFHAGADDSPDVWESVAGLATRDGIVVLFRVGELTPPDSWTGVFAGDGYQMVLTGPLGAVPELPAIDPATGHAVTMRSLDDGDVDAMVALVALTEPGPFRRRTIDLGGYVGIFHGDELVGMAGQRLAPPGYREVSAVCTHPDARRRRYASIVSAAVARTILERGETPFLHVAVDNAAAIPVYEQLGFTTRGIARFAAYRVPSYELMNDQVATADEADAAILRAEHGAWILAALAHLGRAGALGTDVIEVHSDEDAAAAAVLVAAGLANVSDPGVTLFRAASGLVESWARFPADAGHEATMSILRQVAAAAGVTESGGTGWGALDDATLLAQGRSSAVGGTMLATFAVPSLPGLAARFAAGGRFLDVGTGVGELAAAFAEALPTAYVVGLDVLPRAIELARQTIAARHLGDRVELRLHGIEDLAAGERFDLAWVPAPFIPRPALITGVRRVADALAEGGWVIVAAGRFDGDPLGVAVTRWQTQRAGGTPLDARDARELLTSTGLGGFFVVPTPPGGPALYAARRPELG